jgi:hypothetical protein
MPRGKSTMPPMLAASDKYRRANERLVHAKKELQRAEAAYAEAETAYLGLVAQTPAVRQRVLAEAGRG